MNVSLSDTDQEVRDYVAQVRAGLADLPAEDVDEFTIGMEADLAERLAEPGEGTLRDRLGDPASYAAELRAAAGLPARAVAPTATPSLVDRAGADWAKLVGGVLNAVPWLRDLRPLWWVMRGFGLAALPAGVLGVSIWTLGILGAGVSVVLGLMARYGRLSDGWVRPTRIVVNLIAVLLLPVALLLAGAETGGEAFDEEALPLLPVGLAVGGEPISNLYAYDESGLRLDKVRLFDQSGRPVRVDAEEFRRMLELNEVDAGEQIIGRDGELLVDEDVFPVRVPDRSGWEQLGPDGWTPPVAIAPLPGPVPSVGASPSPTPSASPTPTPATSPSSGVSASPTPTPSASASASR